MVSSGIFGYKHFPITNNAWTPIIIPWSCCYISFWNLSDAMILCCDTDSGNENLPLAQGIAQMITAPWTGGDYRFKPGEVVCFAKGVNQANSSVTLTTVRK